MAQTTSTQVYFCTYRNSETNREWRKSREYPTMAALLQARFVLINNNKHMKTIKYLAAVVLLCAGCAVSYYAGYNANNKPVEDNKHYEAACRMADVIRCYQDHLSEDSIIEDYGCFEEIVGTYLDEYNDGTPVSLEEYSWAY